MKYQYFTKERLHSFTVGVLQYHGIPEKDAVLAADVLSYSDISGIDSHGVARLKIYSWYLEQGRINPRPDVRVLRDRTSVATVDGDNGMGLVVAPRAFEIAMDKAMQHGSGWVAICNSNHYGAAGYYIDQALQRDLIGLSMTNASKVVAPLWGRERMLGTNPISMGFPGAEEPPVVIDFASSAVSFGKVEIQKRKGEPLPEGWAINKEGVSTSRPEDFMDDAALLPLGSDKLRGGHKGYGLASLVDLLCGPLSGANWGPFVPPFAVGFLEQEQSVGKGIGHFLGAWDIESFQDLDTFKRQVDHWIRTMRKARPIPGKERVLIPGDPEREARAVRLEGGVPLLPAVVNDLEEISRKTGVQL